MLSTPAVAPFHPTITVRKKPIPAPITTSKVELNSFHSVSNIPLSAQKSTSVRYETSNKTLSCRDHLFSAPITTVAANTTRIKTPAMKTSTELADRVFSTGVETTSLTEESASKFCHVKSPDKSSMKSTNTSKYMLDSFNSAVSAPKSIVSWSITSATDVGSVNAPVVAINPVYTPPGIPVRIAVSTNSVSADVSDDLGSVTNFTECNHSSRKHVSQTIFTPSGITKVSSNTSAISTVVVELRASTRVTSQSVTQCVTQSPKGIITTASSNVEIVTATVTNTKSNSKGKSAKAASAKSSALSSAASRSSAKSSKGKSASSTKITADVTASTKAEVTTDSKIGKVFFVLAC